jgi:hypothetical protein
MRANHLFGVLGDSPMSLADELQKLQSLRDSGTLSEEEFGRAKASLLNSPPQAAPEHDPAPQRPDALGEAAKTWVNFQIVMGVIGLAFAAIFFFAFFLPRANDMGKRHQEFKARQQQIDDAREKHRQEREELRQEHGLDR